MCAGFYCSDDLIHWTWHENRNLDIYRYAPDARQVGSFLVFSTSDWKAGTLYRTLDPVSGQFEKVSEPFSFGDPNVFQDDSGRVYLYWGCSNSDPLYGVELDSKSLLPIGEKANLILGDSTAHGWERFIIPDLYESNNPPGSATSPPYIEGAFMNKWNGKYYLQYAAPATELVTYGDGVYVGSGPLGPFLFQAHNPFSCKPGGFITGAGHGSTIEDKYGNLWHASTMRISVNAAFERRVGIFPAGLDQDGILFCNQSFGDYPMDIPEGRFDPLSIKPKWMLLSYKKACTASSYVHGHEPSQAANEDIRSCWCADGSAGQWLQMDLGMEYPVYAIQINFAEVGIPMLKKAENNAPTASAANRYTDTDPSLKTRYLLEGSLDSRTWFTLSDKRCADTDLSHDYLQFEGMPVRYLKITATQLPYNETFAISGLRVFGLGAGSAPAAVEYFLAERTNPLTARIRWHAAIGAMGYDVKYGIAPDMLYSSHMVYEACVVLLTTLNKDQPYYIRIDSFNENGITEGITGLFPTR